MKLRVEKAQLGVEESIGYRENYRHIFLDAFLTELVPREISLINRLFEHHIFFLLHFHLN